MLFNPKNQKAIKFIWMTLCIILIASMILMYIPALF